MGTISWALGNLGWLREKEEDWQEREHFEQAITILRKAQPANQKNTDIARALGNQYQSLAESAIRLGDHAAAATAARAMADTDRDRAQDCYFAACFLARSVPLAENDVRIAEVEKRKSVAESYANDAIAMLGKAKEAGTVRRLPNEQEIFKAVLHLPRFKKSLANLENKPKS